MFESLTLQNKPDAKINNNNCIFLVGVKNVDSLEKQIKLYFGTKIHLWIYDRV